jgi:hypothetical protein
VQGQPFYFRDPGSGANAWANNDGLDNYDTDIAFTLYGTVTAAGHIASLSAATLPRSGFLEILGTNFGGSGSVSIGGLTAPVATWSGERVVAYVPESSALGAVSVQLTNTSGQPSNSVSLDVTARVPDGRVQWRFRMDGPYSQVRPVIGPDGTIYTVDVFGHLYALSPDGGLKWVVRSGAKGVAVDANGDVYTASESHIRAFHSDGSAKWTFTQTPLAFILVGIGVGPDGNIYAAATEGMGVFSLTPDGDLRWQTPNPYDRVPIDYNEVVFGDNSGTGQLYFYANRRLRGITLAGDPVFEVVGGLAQLQVADSPAVSPDGSVHTAISAFSPDGDAIWTFDTPYPYNVFTKSSVGSTASTTTCRTSRSSSRSTPNGTGALARGLADYVGRTDRRPDEHAARRRRGRHARPPGQGHLAQLRRRLRALAGRLPDGERLQPVRRHPRALQRRTARPRISYGDRDGRQRHEPVVRLRASTRASTARLLPAARRRPSSRSRLLRDALRRRRADDRGLGLRRRRDGHDRRSRRGGPGRRRGHDRRDLSVAGARAR